MAGNDTQSDDRVSPPAAPVPDPPLTADRIRPHLMTHVFGHAIEAYTVVSSTNDRARAAAARGAAEGLLVVADVQEAGRGRRGRVWQAPAGGAILASLLLRPQTPLTEAFAPTMLLGLAIQRTAQGLGVPAGLKWPNDVLVRGRKLAGILAEGTTRAGFLDYVVMGFGLNVGFDPAALDLGDRATSLQIEMDGVVPDRAAVLGRILLEAEKRYRAWQAGGYAALWSEWAAALTTLGTVVRVEVGAGEILTGPARRVEYDGALIVGTPEGERRVVAGTLLSEER